MKRTVIPYLKPIFNNSKLKIEMKTEMIWCIFLSVQQLWQIATMIHKLRLETGLLNTSRDVCADDDASVVALLEGVSDGGGHFVAQVTLGLLATFEPR